MKLCRVRDITGVQGTTLFRRYTLVETRWFAVYLHRFVRGDPERCFHDHPWWFVAVLLWGGYWEEMPSGRHWRRPGSILWRPATTAHRIAIHPRTRPWSLVVRGPKRREWGFFTPRGWVAWRPDFSPICETEGEQ